MHSKPLNMQKCIIPKKLPESLALLRVCIPHHREVLGPSFHHSATIRVTGKSTYSQGSRNPTAARLSWSMTPHSAPMNFLHENVPCHSLFMITVTSSLLCLWRHLHILNIKKKVFRYLLTSSFVLNCPHSLYLYRASPNYFYGKKSMTFGTG